MYYFTCLHVSRQHGDAPGRDSDAVELGGARALGPAPHDGLGKLDGQRGSPDDHRVPGCRSRAHLHASAVWVSIICPQPLRRYADGGQAVGMAASCAHKAVAPAAAAILECRIRLRFEHEALEIAGLGDAIDDSKVLEVGRAAPERTAYTPVRRTHQHVVLVVATTNCHRAAPSAAPTWPAARCCRKLPNARVKLTFSAFASSLCMVSRPQSSTPPAPAEPTQLRECAYRSFVESNTPSIGQWELCILQTNIMRLLNGSCACGTGQDTRTPCLRDIANTRRRLPVVASWWRPECELPAPPRPVVLEQMAQQLHGHVLEGQRGAVGQGLEPQAVFQWAHGHDGLGAKDFPGIGLGADGPQVAGRDVVDVQRQNLECQRRIALGSQRLAQLIQAGIIDCGVLLGQVQPAIGRQAFEQDVAKTLAVRMAARGKVHHQFNSSLRMRLMGASTEGSPWICANAASMSPSRVAWVRMIRSVCVEPSPPTSPASRCSTASMLMPAPARMPVILASTPASSATRMRRLKGQVRHAVLRVAGGQAGHIHQIGNHRAGRRLAARALAIVQRGAHGIAMDHHGVHRPLHVGDQALGGNQRRVHAQLYSLPLAPLGDAQQLDTVAQLLGVPDVGGRQLGDALHMRLVELHGDAEGDGAHQRDLVGCVHALDVEGGVGFGVAQALRLFQHHGKIKTLVAHLAEDEIGGR
ncbi:hypothetical protein FQR65_LT20242 [Abscondita terminalis]|nr:hypothetical protein FQR65_LT20242 [Abscondita terminalis]